MVLSNFETTNNGFKKKILCTFQFDQNVYIFVWNDLGEVMIIICNLLKAMTNSKNHELINRNICELLNKQDFQEKLYV